MQGYCHRCHGELPARLNDRRDDDDAGLFCPRCSAPQLKLPEHMRVETMAVTAGDSTGAQPPPRVAGMKQVDWHAALTCSAMVAAGAAALTLVGLKLNGVALLGMLWVMSGSVISLGLYRKRVAGARLTGRLNARAGLRIGVVTGVLMLATLGVTGAVSGVVMRFATHGMDQFDAQSAERTREMQAWMVNFMAQRGQDKATQDQYIAMMNSPRMTAPETRAGGELVSLGVQGVLIVLISAGGGAFAGMLQGRREAGGAQ